MVFGLCLVGVVLFVLLGCFLCCLPLFFVSAWWNRGIADEVTIASFCKAVTGTAVMARSANEKKKALAFQSLRNIGFETLKVAKKIIFEIIYFLVLIWI